MGSGLGFGLIGRKLGHSFSPLIHERLGSAPYRLIELEPDEVATFIAGREWDGLNVTIPYKRDAALAADVRSPRVEALGVANTLVRLDDGRILAENTDVLGFNAMLAEFARRELESAPADVFADKKALVLGTGGAAQAVAYALREFVGAEVAFVSRAGESTYETLLDQHGDAELLINATPVGMYPNCPASPLSDACLEQLAQLKAVVDVVYNPYRTGICMQAERLGIPWQSGLSMLVWQAYYASKLFQSLDLDESVVPTIADEVLRSTINIALIGMPGSGKSSCGRVLASSLGRPFVDIDDAIEAECGTSPEAIIKERGEDAFRDIETKVLSDYAGRSGLVIACGGGVVTRQRNYAPLRQNSTIVFIDRPLDELACDGRPLSKARGVQALAEERMASYIGWSDIRHACLGSAEKDAKALMESLHKTNVPHSRTDSTAHPIACEAPLAAT